MFLGRILPALVMGIIFAASYLLNFVILRMEDFALLSGTIVLAVILGVMMALTGKINRKQEN
jgi:inner membrane protein involved in colicin E2 resistance